MKGKAWRWTATALVALVATAAAGTASAASPDHWRSGGTDVVVYEPCGFVEVYDWTLHGTTYYDKDGNVTRIVLRFAFDGVIENPQTGETWIDESRNVVVLDPDGGGTLSGVAFDLRVHGEGVVFLAAGRLVFGPDGETVFTSARMFGLEEIGPALCAALT
jgi:hypothetical protein